MKFPLRLHSHFREVLQPLLAVGLGLFAGLMVCFFAGENPWSVFLILIRGAFGTGYDFGMTLYYATPLIFTGLSVSIAFQAGLFNIGAEGQLVLGAIGVAAVGIAFPNLPALVAMPLAIVAAMGLGGFWGWIAGWLRANRGSHEVITTIMLNFIAAGLTSWATLSLLKNPDNQIPETAVVGPGFVIPSFGKMGLEVFGDSPVGPFFLVGLIFCAFYGWALKNTVLGFRFRMVGANESAAGWSGIPSKRLQVMALAISGAMAGWVGVAEVCGGAERFKIGFSPGYGFIGIAVALLGRAKPMGVIFSALLFGALHKGTNELDFDTENITRDLALVLQAMVILFVSAEGLWTWFRKPGVQT